MLTVGTVLSGLILAPAAQAHAEANAQAHAHLMTRLPAADCAAANPGDIEFRFSEAPLAMVSGVPLQTTSGAIVPGSSKEMDRTILAVVPQHPLKAGSYTVSGTP